MFNVVLFEPEVPPNTGNIIRLCANIGCKLHLIHPLGFQINDKTLRRAGLDYFADTQIFEYQNFTDFIQQNDIKNLYAIETGENKIYSEVLYKPGDYILFGPETRGLPAWLLVQIKRENILRIPMQKNSRSINLSNCVAIVVYEAWRQNGWQRV